MDTRKYGYVRVSTEDQSIDLQVAALERHGVDVIFTDKMSGGVMDRPQLNRVLRLLREGDELVVWKLDRLGRSLIGVVDAVEKLTKAGVKVRSLTEGIDPGTPVGRMMIGIIAGFAQMERELISERTKAGMAAYRAKGGRVGKKHFVLDYPARLKEFRRLWPMIHDGTLTGAEVIERMHQVQPDPPIRSVQSFYNWKRKGFGRFSPDNPLEDKEAGD